MPGYESRLSPEEALARAEEIEAERAAAQADVVEQQVDTPDVEPTKRRGRKAK